MAEDLSKEIEKEIQDFKKKFKENWGMKFFDNFDGNLPGGYRTFLRPGTLSQKLYLESNICSEKRKLQTGYEFQNECREAVIEAGLTPEEIITARKLYDDKKDRNLFNLLVPIYIVLRERGYLRYPDLTA